ncbi:MAG: hypothetical protein GKR89_00345 [Candidatus Latescibacteria bacterium]|nr:hypothetical protein [Candidatus Latescibacterota bacterium]
MPFRTPVPPHYSDSAAEYRAARTRAVLCNTSAWSRFLVSGADHLDFLHRMSTNHFLACAPDSGLEAVLPDNRGRLLDLGAFYRRPDQTLAIFSPAMRTDLPAWLDRYIFAEEIELSDITDTTALFELCGPQAGQLANRLLGIDLTEADRYSLLGEPQTDGTWINCIQRWGAPALQVVAPATRASQLWDALQDQGAVACGTTAGEIMRIETGTPAWGRELTQDHNPWEAGLERAIHMDKGCYIGQEVIARLDTYDKIKQRLLGLQWTAPHLPTDRTPIQAQGRPAGTLTSAIYSPRLQRTVALAYVRRAYWQTGTQVEFELDGDRCQAEVTALPFDA